MELLNTHPIKKSDLGFHGNLFACFGSKAVKNISFGSNTAILYVLYFIINI